MKIRFRFCELAPDRPELMAFTHIRRNRGGHINPFLTSSKAVFLHRFLYQILSLSGTQQPCQPYLGQQRRGDGAAVVQRIINEHTVNLMGADAGILRQQAELAAADAARLMFLGAA